MGNVSICSLLPNVFIYVVLFLCLLPLKYRNITLEDLQKKPTILFPWFCMAKRYVFITSSAGTWGRVGALNTLTLDL